ncbi:MULTISPECIES: F0F1 ATP synthase subunit delta [Thiomicrorhabdus]|uniref:ATP synthase subunit b n=1 Tax=Thiomicrorhabdus heinhorstiae TaxID=2748010 RepID=A0ABS0BVA8_9GAMM|nr:MULTISPECIES: F0F1 ATP synthase subunit delta [Thiomicrorhabdus]MBF6057715.1 F0F1 ATP synthase subunit delta [Thiomicrorhabdus heinhorstiae]
MEFSWSTFIFEIINFVVLMWILKHFLYHPVLNALEKRRESVRRTLEEAQQKIAQADDLKARYEQRLQAWEEEKNQLRRTLQEELDSLRTNQQQQLQEELQTQKHKAEINQRQELQEILQHYQSIAHRQGAEFASKLLRDLAGKETQTRLFEALLEQLQSLDEEQIKRLQKTCNGSVDKVNVCSAYPLTEKNRRRLQAKLKELCPQTLSFDYQEDPQLISGLRVHLGAWSLRMNLLDELNRFMELDRDRLNQQ